MDIQTIINNAVSNMRQEELKNSPQLLLGEIILKLEMVKDKTKPLFIDILNKRPMGIDSWRGSYAELAIQTESLGSYNTDKIIHESQYGNSYEHKIIGKENPNVKEWIDVCKEVIGKTFTGYKGGDFTMSKNTPVYLAEYGNSSFKIDDKEIDEKDYSNYKTIYFIDVEEKEDKVWLITATEE